MRRLALPLAFALAACGDGPTGTRRPVADGFVAPVDGAPRTSNVFDHDSPFPFTDTNGYQLSWWGERVAGIDGHAGYDFVVPLGTPVRAATDGVVKFAGTESAFFCPLLGETVAGLRVVVQHEMDAGDYESRYLHFSRIDVRAGDRVAAGQPLGLSGTTGCSTGPHLHFEVQRTTPEGRPIAAVDPYGWQDAGTVDPWSVHSVGATSVALWGAGAAPPIYAEARGPLPGGAPVGIVAVRWMGVRDATRPQNEFVDVERAPGSASVDLTGWTLRTLSSTAWTFPEGTVLNVARPRVRVHVGPPVEPGSLGMRRLAGIIDNRGDCVALDSPTGVRYAVLIRTASCPMPGAGTPMERMRRLPLAEPGDAAPGVRSWRLVTP